MFPYCCLPLHITVIYIFMLLNCMALFHITLVEADVKVLQIKNNLLEKVYSDNPAHFGVKLQQSGLKGYVVYSNPPNACQPIKVPPKVENYTGNWIVLIQRFGCSFQKKVHHAQMATYSAAIIHNVNSDALELMGPVNDEIEIDIPSVFIGSTAGKDIENNYQYNKGYYVLLTGEPPFDINSYLLPFAIVVGICFLVMLLFMIVKCIQDRRRQRRHRLPASSLKKIPTTKFKKGDPYDSCAICLEDYMDGDKLRVLPCSHAYHTKCIDPWLTKNRRVCPLCKRKVFAQDEQISDSESETEDESSPLIQTGNYGTQGGTFVPQRVNPIMAAQQRLQAAAALVQQERQLQAAASGAETEPSALAVCASPRVQDTSSRVQDASSRVQDNSRVQDTTSRVQDTSRVEDASSRVQDTSSTLKDVEAQVHSPAAGHRNTVAGRSWVENSDDLAEESKVACYDSCGVEEHCYARCDREHGSSSEGHNFEEVGRATISSRVPQKGSCETEASPLESGNGHSTRRTATEVAVDVLTGTAERSAVVSDTERRPRSRRTDMVV